MLALWVGNVFTHTHTHTHTHTKPGKEGRTEVTKYWPISLLNVGGKVFEKLLIDRINHHVFSNRLLNENRYGFLPQKSTVDAALAVKSFIRENLQQKNCVVLVGFDVRGAFDAAWWPCILSNLRDLQCPKNLYDLALNYFRDRVASLKANTHKENCDERLSSRFMPRPRILERHVQRSLKLKLF